MAKKEIKEGQVWESKKNIYKENRLSDSYQKGERIKILNIFSEEDGKIKWNVLNSDYVGNNINLENSILSEEYILENFKKIEDSEEVSHTPELKTLEQKREFFIGKRLNNEEGEDDLGFITNVIFKKILDKYEIVLDDGSEYGFNEEELISLSKGEIVDKLSILELQTKQEPEENISISKEALEFLAGQKGASVDKILEQLEGSDRSDINEIISEYKDKLFIKEEVNEGDGKTYEIIDLKKSEIKPVEEVKKNSPDFKYYALTPENKIVFGAEYKEDVRDFINDRKQYTKLRLVSKRDLPVDAELNENWIADTSEKQEIAKRIIAWYEADINDIASEHMVNSVVGTSNKDVLEFVPASDFIGGDTFRKIVTLYGDHILQKAALAKEYLMPNTEKSLREEYKKLEMFY